MTVRLELGLVVVVVVVVVGVVEVAVIVVVEFTCIWMHCSSSTRDFPSDSIGLLSGTDRRRHPTDASPRYVHISYS